MEYDLVSDMVRENYMTNTLFCAAALVMVVAAGTVGPALAQTTTTPAASAQRAETEDDGFDLGWLGLLGLLGLAGLMRPKHSADGANKTDVRGRPLA